MAANAAVVIPVYKEELNEFEKISLAQVKKVLSNYPIIFVAPEGKIFPYMAGSMLFHAPLKFFQNVHTYSIMLSSPNFYRSFLNYDYILIHQLDAFVFSDELEYFCNLGYDYIGAAWPLIWSHLIYYKGKRYVARVGNGGFSLRNVKACCKVFDEQKEIVEAIWGKSEDDFWALMGIIEESNFRTAPVKIANQFSVEYFPDRVIKRNGGKLPFGCHGWYRFNADSYTKIFSSLGYDLGSLPEKFESKFIGETKERLIKIANERLRLRLQLGQSVMRYLPKKRYTSIRVIRHSETMKLLARLMLENNELSDKVFFYNEDEQDILIQDLQAEKLPHLILTEGGGCGRRLTC